MKRDFLFIREVDRLGRICLPIEMRRAYEIDKGAQVVITTTPDGIFLRSIGDAKEQEAEEMLEAIKEREKR